MLLDFYTKTQSPTFLSLILNLEQVDAMHDWCSQLVVFVKWLVWVVRITTEELF
jgi:hypothetical protein